MTLLLAIVCLTTAIASASALSATQASLQKRILPWSGGVLLGIALFWVLPNMAEEHGWPGSVSGVAAILLLLAAIDRYVYPLCPFCAAGVHAHHDSEHGHRHGITLVWPLL